MLSYEILVDHGETPNKCTILPLAYRSDFHIVRAPFPRRLGASILLHPEGVPFPDLDLKEQTINRLAAIDCIWRRLDPILADIDETLPLRVRIPHGFVTAYPRVSRRDFDPEGGLATIEAIFIAACFLGTKDTSLLREYFFAERFMQLNAPAFERYGIDVPWQSPLFLPVLPRNSQTRRIGRGRVPR